MARRSAPTVSEQRSRSGWTAPQGNRQHSGTPQEQVFRATVPCHWRDLGEGVYHSLRRMTLDVKTGLSLKPRRDSGPGNSRLTIWGQHLAEVLKLVLQAAKAQNFAVESWGLPMCGLVQPALEPSHTAERTPSPETASHEEQPGDDGAGRGKSCTIARQQPVERTPSPIYAWRPSPEPRASKLRRIEFSASVKV